MTKAEAEVEVVEVTASVAVESFLILFAACFECPACTAARRRVNDSCDRGMSRQACLVAAGGGG
jgi:heterodisulfide reductase subunit C